MPECKWFEHMSGKEHFQKQQQIEKNGTFHSEEEKEMSSLPLPLHIETVQSDIPCLGKDSSHSQLILKIESLVSGISVEWDHIMRLNKLHPHSQVLCDGYLELFSEIAKGNLKANMFPNKISQVEELFHKVNML
jgi:hypothetical protein